MKIVKTTLLVLLCLLLAASAAAAAYYFSVTAGVRLNSAKLEPTAYSISVYDKDGAPVAQIAHGAAKKKISIECLPDHVRGAFLAAEDKNFYSHHGLDYKGMARALLKNIRARSFKQGASTISQQLVKNTQLTPERTLRRKLREIKLTRQLERKYSKDAILELYLNTIYFGHACYGIASAAEFYFGKEAGSLNAAEAATLAAIIRSPNRYSPFSAPEKCKAVRNSVLEQMKKLGMLDEAECAAAQRAPLPERGGNAVAAQSYLDAVSREFDELPLLSPYAVRGGCKVYTYLDRSLQRYAETLRTTADRSGRSIAVCSNDEHAVCALYTTEGELRRQPGSVIKPLAVYAPAIEEGLLAPCTPVLDEKTDFDGYAPSNYKDIYHGYVSAREALANSYNVPAVKFLRQLGTERSARYLQSLGLRLNEEDKTLALALGGLREGYTLRELAGAYAAFACGGEFAPLACIRKIEDGSGNVLYERKAELRRVFSEDTAELINDMLTRAAQDGTAKKLHTLPFRVCAKTGTCGTDEGNTDAYTIAYTPAHTVAVWMGNADNSRTDISGGGLPCHYAMLLLKEIYKEKAPPAFKEGAAVRLRLDRAAYESEHTVLLAAETQPERFTVTELFCRAHCPKTVSPLFSEPYADASIRCNKQTVLIDLCHTEYYAYIIKDEFNGKTTLLFDGFVNNGTFADEKEKPKGKHRYSVTPYYLTDGGERIYGKEQRLPDVWIEAKEKDAKQYGNWWLP